MIENWRSSRTPDARRALRTAHRARRRLVFGMPPVRLAIVAGALVAIAVAGWLIARPGSNAGAHTNRAGGYSFVPPEGWAVSERGSATSLRSPSGDTVIAFGLGQGDTIQQASSVVLDAIREVYSKVELSAGVLQTVNGNPALLVSGQGTNAGGVRLRFLTVTLEGGERTYAITVFTDAAADPGEVLPPAQAVIDSFTPAAG